MFERFTERARQVIVLAQQAARDGKEGTITTKHLLIGLIKEEEGVAAVVLSDLGIDEDTVTSKDGGESSEPQPEKLEYKVAGQIPFTQEAKRALELALREALGLGHNYIGTEHLLLGLVRSDSCIAANILIAGWGLTGPEVRNSVVTHITEHPRERGPIAKPPSTRRVVWKYELNPVRGGSVHIPEGSEFLYFDTQDGVPTMWWSVPVSPEGSQEDWPLHEFRTYPTGLASYDAAKSEYIGTFQIGGFVGHVFEKREGVVV